MKYSYSGDDNAEFVASKQRYVDYIQSVWPRLPPDLRLLCDRSSEFSPDKIYLNDSNVQSIKADFDRKTVEIVLLGEALDWNVNQIGQRWFTLSYAQVQRLSTIGEYRLDLPYHPTDGDHVWDEVEVLDNGLFEHRMLFAGRQEVELTVTFGSFTLSYTDTPISIVHGRRAT